MIPSRNRYFELELMAIDGQACPRSNPRSKPLYSASINLTNSIDIRLVATARKRAGFLPDSGELRAPLSPPQRLAYWLFDLSAHAKTIAHPKIGQRVLLKQFVDRFLLLCSLPSSIDQRGAALTIYKEGLPNLIPWLSHI